MMERKISASRVADVLRSPQKIEEAKEDAHAYTRSFGSKRLKVIARQTGKNAYVIITAYYL